MRIGCHRPGWITCPHGWRIQYIRLWRQQRLVVIGGKGGRREGGTTSSALPSPSSLLFRFFWLSSSSPLQLQQASKDWFVSKSNEVRWQFIQFKFQVCGARHVPCLSFSILVFDCFCALLSVLSIIASPRDFTFRSLCFLSSRRCRGFQGNE